MKDTNAFKYSLVMKGLYGRNRTAKFKLFDLGLKSEDSDVVRAEMVLKGQEMVRDLKGKPGCLFAIQVQPLTIEKGENGVEWVSFQCFTAVRIFEGKV